ncbi:hypothetical protein LY41_000692 [Prauserella halophila]|nr:hypothetical protein [Prauserella halophila]
MEDVVANAVRIIETCSGVDIRNTSRIGRQDEDPAVASPLGSVYEQR